MLTFRTIRRWIEYPATPLAMSIILTCAALPAPAIARDVNAYAVAAASQLPEPAQAALQSISSEARQLLALRGYLRAGRSLTTRWSWTAQQIEEYERSPQYQSLLQAIEEVNGRFQSRNPGYSLFANTQVRSLDLQLQRWNENPTVGTAATHLLAAAREELSKGYPLSSDAAATQRFIAFLQNTVLEVPVSLAAPGLSLHGQSRAIDFQVQRGDVVVAGPNMNGVANVWHEQGWANKLAQAVKVTPAVFAGPLKVPDEPWHYEYIR
jgi:hypothetical protein